MEVGGQLYTLASSPGKSAWYPLDMRLSGPQSRSECCGEKNLAPCWESNTGHPAHSPSLYWLSYPDSHECYCEVVNNPAFILIQTHLSLTNIIVLGICTVRVPVGARFLSFPCHRDRFWSPPSLLSNGYRGLFPRGKVTQAWSWPLTSN
jgi:hypothetical protein